MASRVRSKERLSLSLSHFRVENVLGHSTTNAWHLNYDFYVLLFNNHLRLSLALRVYGVRELLIKGLRRTMTTKKKKRVREATFMRSD